MWKAAIFHQKGLAPRAFQRKERKEGKSVPDMTTYVKFCFWKECSSVREYHSILRRLLGRVHAASQ